MSRKKHLIDHPPTAAMSLRQELRVLSRMLEKCVEPDAAIRLTKRMDAIRNKIKPPVKRAVGRPKKVKIVQPQPETQEDLINRRVLEIERARRTVATADAPVVVVEPSQIEQQIAQIHEKAEAAKVKEAAKGAAAAERITCPQSAERKDGGGVAPLKSAAADLVESVVGSGLVDFGTVVARADRDGDDPIESIGSAAATNARLARFEYGNPTAAEKIVREEGYLADWAGVRKP